MSPMKYRRRPPRRAAQKGEPYTKVMDGGQSSTHRLQCLLSPCIVCGTTLWGSSADANRVMDKVRLSPRGRSAQQRPALDVTGANSITTNPTIDIRKHSNRCDQKKSLVANLSKSWFFLFKKDLSKIKIRNVREILKQICPLESKVEIEIQCLLIKKIKPPDIKEMAENNFV